MYHNFEENESLSSFGSDIYLDELNIQSNNDSIIPSIFSLNKDIENDPIPSNSDFSEKRSIPSSSPSETNDFSESSINKKGNPDRKPAKDRPEEENSNKKVHRKDKNDNMMAKIQRSFFNKFLINFLNLIMSLLGLKYNFLKLNGAYVGNINQQFRESLFEKTIKDIINEAPIFGRFKEGKKDNNKNIIRKLKEEDHSILLNIMEKRCLYFFEKIYFNNLRTFNLNLFGFDSLEINLPMYIELFNDLLNRKNFSEDVNYKDRLRHCARKNFFSRVKEI